MEPHCNWYCHSCTQENQSKAKACVRCGRPEDYVEDGYEFALLGNGGQVFRPSHADRLVADIHETDENNWTALHNACYLGNVELVKKLLSMGADVLSSTIHGQTPLHFAVQSCNPEIVKCILKLGPDVNAATSGEKVTPLHLACSHNGGNMTIVKMLIDKGANVSALNILERTPLHFAGSAGRPDIGSLLMKHGCDADRMDLHGWTCRQVAEYERHFDFAEMIVRSKMTDKQSVIKTLPPAEYSGSLWTDIYTEHCNDRAALQAETLNHQRVEAQIDEARRRIKERKLADHLIHHNQTDSFVTNLQGVSDHYYRRKTGRDKPHDTTYETDPLKKIEGAGGITVPKPKKVAEAAPRKVYTEADYRAEEAAMGGALGASGGLGLGMKYMFVAPGSAPAVPCPGSANTLKSRGFARTTSRDKPRVATSDTGPLKLKKIEDAAPPKVAVEEAVLGEALGASGGVKSVKYMFGSPGSAPAAAPTVKSTRLVSTALSVIKAPTR
jgi:hypothetical protein